LWEIDKRTIPDFGSIEDDSVIRRQWELPSDSERVKSREIEKTLLKEWEDGTVRTIICGVDGSPGARSAVGLGGLTDVPVLVAPLPARSPGAVPAAGDSTAGPGADTRDAHARPAAPAEVAPVARTTVEEQRRLRRTARVSLRPPWSRGRFPNRVTRTNAHQPRS
jgi:hypothetical protein